jgi:hypothetical protein
VLRPGFLLPILAIALAFPFKGNAGVEVPCDFSAGLIRLRVTAMGRSEPLQFLLDSGASQSVIDTGCARRIGLKAASSRSITGVNWQGQAEVISNFDGQLAGMPLPRSMLAIDLREIANSEARIDGILGLDFIRQHVVQLDYAKRRVRFYRPGEVSAEFGGLALVSRNGALCVRATVNGTARLLRLDTGCNTDIECVELKPTRSGKGEPSVAIHTESGTRLTRARLTLGNHELTEIESGWHDRRFFPGEDGLLGNGVLSRFTVTIDAAGRRLYLSQL